MVEGFEGREETPQVWQAPRAETERMKRRINGGQIKTYINIGIRVRGDITTATKKDDRRKGRQEEKKG